MLANVLPAYPERPSLAADMDVANLQSLLQGISLGDAHGLPRMEAPQQQQQSADVMALLQELNHYNNLQSAITILRLTAALNQSTNVQQQQQQQHQFSTPAVDNTALQLQLLLAQQQQQQEQQRQQQQQTAALLATIDPSLAGLDLGALGLPTGMTTSPNTTGVPQQHRPKTRRGTRGKGRGRKKNVTARAPTWAGSDWSPKQGVVSQQEHGTGVFIPGSPTNARSVCSDDDGSESGRSDASQCAMMVLPECPWY